MRSSLPCVRTSSMSVKRPETPYIGMPACRKGWLSVSPVPISGTTGTAGLNARGDAGRTHRGVVEGALRKTRDRRAVRAGTLNDDAHVLRRLPRLDRRHTLEVCARRLV